MQNVFEQIKGKSLHMVSNTSCLLKAMRNSKRTRNVLFDQQNLWWEEETTRW